ncbi:MAG: DUF2513 domain-containing protein [Planctomycetota bacterium]
MKRDPQLIRQILLTCESHEHGFAPSKLAIEGYTEEEIGYHVYLLGDARYMNVIDMTSFRSNQSPKAMPRSLTHAGHDFLDAIRDEEVWKSTKTIIAKTGGWTLGVIASVATEIITRKAMAAIGS